MPRSHSIHLAGVFVYATPPFLFIRPVLLLMLRHRNELHSASSIDSNAAPQLIPFGRRD
jgi:hypothetical protein